MAEQKYTPNTSNQEEPLYPVEGRVDVAGDIEEEQRAAYSAHHHPASPQKGTSTSKQSTPSTVAERAGLPPVEGRIDVAGDIEEEQRNAYSAHQH